MKSQGSPKVHVLVLLGGRSTEHEISKKSAAFVLRNLDPQKYEVDPVFIDRKGAWHRLSYEKVMGDLKVCDAVEGRVDQYLNPQLSPSDMKGSLPLPDAQVLREHDGTQHPWVVFPVLHGSYGEDGTLQGLLELLQCAYVGPDHAASANAMDKILSKKLAEHAGVPIVPYLMVRQEAYQNNPEKWEQLVLKTLGDDVFVKPARSGSSVGISSVKKASTNQTALRKAFKDAFVFDDKILVEKKIEAREIEVAAIGGYDPHISTPGEISVPTEDNSMGFYDYQAKYLTKNKSKEAQILIPAPITSEQKKQVQSLAKKVFEALDLYGMARLDFFLEKETGIFYFNEVNTIPGFTSISQFPMLWKNEGWSHEQILEELIDGALKRYETKNKLVRQLALGESSQS